MTRLYRSGQAKMAGILSEIQEIVTKDLNRQDGGGIFITQKITNACWHQIWKWISIPSVGSHLLRYGLATDVNDLQHINNISYTSRQRADYLLQLADRSGPNGYHILYMCIRDDDENPLGHASVIECLLNEAKKHGVTRHHSDLTPSAKLNNVPSTEDIPEGQVIPIATSSQQASIQPAEQIHYPQKISPHSQPGPIRYPRQESKKEHSSSVTNLTDRTVHKSHSDNSFIIPQIPQQASSFASRQNSLPCKMFNSSMGDSTSDNSTDCVSVASNVSDVFPCHTPIRSIDVYSQEIMGVVDGLLNDLSEEKIIESGLDIQMLSTDDIDDFRELVDELLQFMLSCLNGRRRGVLIAGIDCATNIGQYKLSGIQFGYEILVQKIWTSFKNVIASRVSVRNCNGNIGSMNSINIIDERMIQLKVHQVNDSTCTQSVVVMVVVPDWNLCQNFLYVVAEKNKRVVYYRIDGHTTKLKSCKVHQVQERIKDDYIAMINR